MDQRDAVCRALPYNCAGSAVCLEEKADGCHQHPLPHASCLRLERHPRQLSFGVPLTSSVYIQGAEGCQAACSTGYHLARCALGCVECRQDGSEMKAAWAVSQMLAFSCILIVSLIILKTQLWHTLIGKIRLCLLERRFSPQTAHSMGLVGDQCAICISEYSASELVRTLQCSGPGGRGHHFHADCIDRWLLRSSRCPICNADCTPLLRVSDAVAGQEGS
eukprot:TRINITY_DN112979_c0_g1_i1.p1 TRINITY_DN112979_c0_g1~~TRINITY_DN112979_c0_g1_i1.p1  ORF type:complete len:220 (+),score=16.56 TRINITY_DN112979_c0_g1_i1:50-709(+)